MMLLVGCPVTNSIQCLNLVISNYYCLKVLSPTLELITVITIARRYDEI